MAGSDYYIRVAIDPSSIAKAKQQLLALSRLTMPDLDPSGQLRGYQAVTSASRAAFDITSQRAAIEAKMAADARTAAGQQIRVQQQQLAGFKALSQAQRDVLARKAQEVEIGRRAQQMLEASQTAEGKSVKKSTADSLAANEARLAQRTAATARIEEEKRATTGVAAAAEKGVAATRAAEARKTQVFKDESAVRKQLALSEIRTQEFGARQAILTRETLTRRPAVVDRPNAGLQRMIEEQRAAAASSNPLVRAMGSLNSELNTVGGSAFGAGNALARGSLNMRQLAAATVETASRLTFWSAGAAAIFGMVEVLRQVKDAALDADEALVNLARVVNDGSFNRGAAGQAMIADMRELALGAKDVGDAYFEMGKLIGNQNDAIKASETVLIATKIAEIDVADASQQLVKVQRAYGLATSELEPILDKLNDQQNRLGVDIAKSLMGVARAAGVTRTVGGDLDALIARTTVLQRNSGFAPETISRVNQRMAIQLATIKGQQRIAAALQGTGVSLVNSEGTRKDIDALLSDIGRRFNSFTSEQQANISLALVGGGQGGLTSLATTLLQNYGEVEKQTNNVAHSAGSARQELEQTMKSTRNQIRLVGAELQSLGVNLANSGLLNVFGVFITMLRETLELVNGLVEGFNKLPEVLRNVVIGAAAIRGTVGLVRSLAPARAVASTGAQSAIPGLSATGFTALTSANNQLQAGLRRSTAAVEQATAGLAENAAMHVRNSRIVNVDTAAEQRNILMRTKLARLNDANVVSVQAMQKALAGANVAARENAVANANAARGMAILSEGMTRVAQTSYTAAAAQTQQARAQTVAAAEQAVLARRAATAGGPNILTRGIGAVGRNIVPAALLASIIGEVASQSAKSAGHDRLASGFGTVAAVGQGAFLGGAVGGPIGAAIGGAAGGVISLYQRQHDSQQKAVESMDTLTEAAHRLREAQERAAKGFEETSGQQTPLNNLSDSAEAAASFAANLKEAEARLQGEIGLSTVAERQQTKTVAEDMADELRNLKQENSQAFAAGPGNADRLSALEEVAEALRQNKEATLSLDTLLRANPGADPAAAIKSAIKDGGGSTKGLSTAVNSLSARGALSASEIRNLVVQSGVNSAQVDETVAEVQKTLVGVLTQNVLSTVEQSASEAKRDTQTLAQQLAGRLGQKEQLDALQQLNDTYQKFYVGAQQANDPTLRKQGRTQGRKSAEEARARLEADSAALASFADVEQQEFLDGLAETMKGTNNSIVQEFGSKILSFRNQVSNAVSAGDARNILDAADEDVLGLVQQSALIPSAFVDNITNVATRLQLGTIGVKQAIQIGLAEVVSAYALARQNPSDPEAQQLALQTQQAFQSLVQQRVESINAMVQAGSLSDEQGANQILSILAQIENQKGKVPEGLRNANLTQITQTIQNLIAARAGDLAEEARAVIRTTADPNQRQRRQRALNRAVNLLRQSASGGGQSVDAIVRALRAIGISENVIALIEQAGATEQYRARVAKLRAERRAAIRTLNAAKLQLAAAQQAYNEGRANIARIIAAKKVAEAAEKEIAQLEKALASLGKSVPFDKQLADALAQGFTAGADKAIGSLGQERDYSGRDAAEEARQKAEEARQKAMDLVSARFEFLKALAGDDSVKVARLDLQEQEQLLKFARDRAERFRAKAAIINARRALREAILDQANGSNTFGIPTNISLPNAFEVKAAAARALRTGALVGVGETVGGAASRSEVNMTAHNRNDITIVVQNKKDLDRVAEVVSVATSADERAMKSAGFSGGSLL